MAQAELTALWRFDEVGGPVAWNAVKQGAALDVRVAGRTQGKSGSAVQFMRPGDGAAAPLPIAIDEGAISFWFRLDRPTPGGVLLNAQDLLRLSTDRESGDRLILSMGKTTLPATPPISAGQWRHVLVRFGKSGLSLCLDAAKVADDPACTQGIPRFVSLGLEFLTLCPLPSSFVACSVDELAVFSGPVSDAHAAALSRGPIDAPPSRTDCAQPIEVNAGDYIDRDDPTCGLQRAIDAASPSGGRVFIPAGRYVLRQSLHLPPRVALVGAAGQSVLAAAAGGLTSLRRDVSLGDTTVIVEDATLFHPGDGIVVQSDDTGGYNATVAVVEAVAGDVVTLSRPVWGSYAVAKNGFAARWHTMIAGVYAHDLYIADLTIEGRAGIEPASKVNFVTSAIELERSLACRIHRCQVIRWLHDGVCLGKGSWHRVTECLVRDGYGHGYHPGNRMRSCTFQNNVALHNGQDGLFFCCKVEDNIVSGNLFEGNAWSGIGGLGDCNDMRNLVTGNQCIENGRAGILMNGGEHNTVVNNICRGNSRSVPGKWAGIHIVDDTSHAVVRGNHCFDNDANPTQTQGISNSATGEGNVVEENVLV